MIVRMIALLMAAFLSIVAAHADELRPGYLEFSEQATGQWRLVWKAPMMGGVTPTTQPVLPAPCQRAGTPSRTVSSATMVTSLKVICRSSVAGHQIGLADFATAQTDVLVRVQPLGRPVQVMRLTAALPMTDIRVKPDRFQVAQAYFVSGVDHILFGYDHLLFVIALVLLLSGFRTIAMAVTAFTVAHSITLIATTLGWMGLPQRPVEAVIALSILFLAVEIVKKDPAQPRLSERLPWIVAFGFGLLHGFGFAGALKEIGLPESDVPTALLTFNLGVEAGQMLIVAATISCLALLRLKAAALFMPVTRWLAYAIGIVSAFWFFERTLT